MTAQKKWSKIDSWLQRGVTSLFIISSTVLIKNDSYITFCKADTKKKVSTFKMTGGVFSVSNTEAQKLIQQKFYAWTTKRDHCLQEKKVFAVEKRYNTCMGKINFCS